MITELPGLHRFSDDSCSRKKIRETDGKGRKGESLTVRIRNAKELKPIQTHTNKLHESKN